MFDFNCECANSRGRVSIETDNFEKFHEIMSIVVKMMDEEADSSTSADESVSAADQIDKTSRNLYSDFSLENCDGDYVMHCNSKEKAALFCRFLHKKGRTWSSGTSYLDKDNWEVYKENTVYYFNEGSYADVDYALAAGDKILEFDDYFWREK